MVSTSALISPTQPPMTAPRVVRPFHNMERSSTGKFALAPTAKASPTMKRGVDFLEYDTEDDRDDAQDDGRDS
jgi:hypothetical protein